MRDAGALACASSSVGSSRLRPFSTMRSAWASKRAADGGGWKVWAFMPSGTSPVTLARSPATFSMMLRSGATVVTTLTGATPAGACARALDAASGGGAAGPPQATTRAASSSVARTVQAARGGVTRGIPIPFPRRPALPAPVLATNCRYEWQRRSRPAFLQRIARAPSWVQTCDAWVGILAPRRRADGRCAKGVASRSSEAVHGGAVATSMRLAPAARSPAHPARNTRGRRLRPVHDPMGRNAASRGRKVA